jgi:hypothetical protein
MRIKLDIEIPDQLKDQVLEIMNDGYDKKVEPNGPQRFLSGPRFVELCTSIFFVTVDLDASVELPE